MSRQREKGGQQRRSGAYRTAVLIVSAFWVPVAAAQQPAGPTPDRSKAFITGVPLDATEAWALAYGGRMYDTWWLVLGEDEPTTANPAYPASGSATGADTWTCTACHGWDYKGALGVNGRGPDFTGIKGVEGAAGMDPAMIASLLRAAPHNYTPAISPMTPWRGSRCSSARGSTTPTRPSTPSRAR